MYKGKGRIKRILRLCHFELFDKGEGRHKRIQAVSLLFFWKREKGMKKMNSTSFQGIEKPENFGKVLAKGGRRRSSKRLRNQCGKLVD